MGTIRFAHNSIKEKIAKTVDSHPIFQAMLEITFITSIKKLVSDSKCLVSKITHAKG